jgi:hypothetical protein
MSVRVGYSFWGLLEKPEEAHATATTAFAAVGERHLLVDEFLKQGHELVCLQQMRESKPYPGVEYDSITVPEVDVVYLEWRWQQHAQLSADRRNEPDWDRQVQLLDEYTKRGTPIIVFDTDLKITIDDENRWTTMVIAEPSLNIPKVNHEMYSVSCGLGSDGRFRPVRQRIRLPWATDFKPYYETPEYSYNYIYLGNNYERDDQFWKYYGSPAFRLRRDNGIQTIAYGNWIERSPSREDPAKILSDCTSVSFPGRLSYNAGMKEMSKSICTALLAKNDYYSRGFITSRIYEGILAGIPSLIPVEHTQIHKMGLGRYVVKNDEDVIRCVRELQGLRKEWRAQIVSEQLEALKSLADFSPKFKVDVITSYIKSK